MDWPFLSKIYIFSWLLQGWRAVIDGVSCCMNFFPFVGWWIIDVNVIFFFCYILNSTKKKNILFVAYHRMTSSSLSQFKVTSGPSVFSIFVHLPSLGWYFHKSSRVFLPLDPPNIQMLPLCTTISKSERASGSSSFPPS